MGRLSPRTPLGPQGGGAGSPARSVQAPKAGGSLVPPRVGRGRRRARGAAGCEARLRAAGGSVGPGGAAASEPARGDVSGGPAGSSRYFLYKGGRARLQTPLASVSLSAGGGGGGGGAGGGLSNSGARFFSLPLAIPSASPAPGVTSADRGPVCVCARRSGRMAVLKLTDQVGGGGAGGRDARARGGAEPRRGDGGAARSAPASCLLAAKGRSVCGRRLLRKPAAAALLPCAVPALGRRNCALRSLPAARPRAGEGAGGSQAQPGCGCAQLSAGVRCPRARAGQGEGRLEVLLRLLQCCAAWAPPAGAGHGEAGPRRRKEDGGWRGRKDRRLGPYPEPSRRPAQTVALVWSSCLYPFDMTS